MFKPTLVLVIALILPLVYQQLLNLLNRNTIPLHVLRYYVQHPLDDVTIKIPVYIESSDLRFLDVGEAIHIQTLGRLRETERTLPDVQFDFYEYTNQTDALLMKFFISDGNGIYVDAVEGYAALFYTLEAVDANDVPYFGTQLLLDHCYNDEIKNYVADSFLQLVDHDSNNHSFLHHWQFETSLQDPLRLVFVMLSAQTNWEVEQAVKMHLEPVLSILSNYTLEFLHVDEDVKSPSRYIDEHFPEELSVLPNLADFYLSHNSSNSTIYLVYYPFELTDHSIRTMSVDNHSIYSSNENTFLNIKSWGSVYFAHTESYHGYVPALNLADCMWSFAETVLDHYHFPNENMAPALRIQMYKRIATVKNLTYFSHRLSQVVGWLERNTLDSFLGSAILDAFDRREQVKEKLQNYDYDAALQISADMVAMFDKQIQNLDFGNMEIIA
ncbi:hypothetical protein KL918_004746 [Ogataea parapolymorpha]|uniref:Secreted protein n=1 Tax=Ogataea parapolymorpha (strain ATCC 26012 / BCRC 20466 / JCM 22074 / NRRL Y-7560 / DL-1) TaxID=871575 RepID=W1QHE6_OGAPD|nr:hypothetical protein HPODL_04551 [Ogataea parapolymorpha DL-1]ESX01775.1 hypothetical protein HPODL_04551 [Ogataea parapolymorpha DL-1]KAG7865164.1 hypothetical protein KL918_004746 [Ogataea parapolymorpha]KAG7872749.1 hypothetical protein KL916_002794 [Ogataea parapolymorpha]